MFRSPFAGCAIRKTVNERKAALATPCRGLARRGVMDPVRAALTQGDRGTHGQDSFDEQGGVQGLLLRLQPAVRARPRRALPDVPPEQSRGPAAAAAAALRLP